MGDTLTSTTCVGRNSLYLSLVAASVAPALPGNGCLLFLCLLHRIQSQNPLCWAAMAAKHKHLIVWQEVAVKDRL